MADQNAEPGNARADRAVLAPPIQRVDGIEFEGVVARVHRIGDPLLYPEFGNRAEYRDLAELKNIVSQLPGKPVVSYEHPATKKVTAHTPVVGRVISARVDGDLAIARFRVETNEARALVALGSTQLSLGYDTHLDSQNYQRQTEVDHLAMVPLARCGATCSVRVDGASGSCTCQSAARMTQTGSPMADQNPNQEEALRSLESQRAAAEARAVAAETLATEQRGRADQAAGTINVLQEQVAQLRAQIAAGAAAAESEAIQRESARADAAEAQIRTFDSTFEKRVQERVALLNRAAVVMGPEFRADALSDRDVMATVVKHLNASADISPATSTDTIRGEFNARCEQHAATARSMARIAETTAQTARVDARAANEDKRRNQWKQPLPSTALKNA